MKGLEKVEFESALRLCELELVLTDGIFEAEPLLLCKEVAEVRVAEGDGLVRAQLLHGIHLADVESHALQILLQPRHSVLEIDLGPVSRGNAAQVADGVVRVRACVPGRERVIVPGRFDDNGLVIGRGVLWDAEETRCKVQAGGVSLQRLK